MKSKYAQYVHEFDGRWYVAEWDARNGQFRHPAKGGGEWFANGYSQRAVEYVAPRSWPTRKQALAAARRTFREMY